MTAGSYRHSVLLSFVLRLRPDQLAAGRLVGSVEQVDSGRTRSIRNPDELVHFCAEAGLASAGNPTEELL